MKKETYKIDIPLSEELDAQDERAENVFLLEHDGDYAKITAAKCLDKSFDIVFWRIEWTENKEPYWEDIAMCNLSHEGAKKFAEIVNND